jgi:hypothetical protein
VEEVDGDEDRSLDTEMMGSTRREWLLLAGGEVCGDRRVGCKLNEDSALEDAYQAPCAFGHAVIAPERRRQCFGVKRARRARHHKSIRELGAVAERTVDVRVEMRGASLFGGRPRPVSERRLVTDVLVVEAGQLGDPITLVVLMKADDGSPHAESSVTARCRSGQSRANPS